MLKISGIQVPEAELRLLCQKYRVKELSVFGSRARGDNRTDSDVDLLVEFLPDDHSGLIAYIALQQELAKLLGKDVDLAPKNNLKPLVKREVLPEARVIYEAS
jgi:predicted nucleotidyltransferase